MMNRRPRQPESIQVEFWVANTLRTRMDQLLTFAHLDVILVNEIHFLPTNRVNLPNY